MNLILKDLEDLRENAPSSPREELSGNLFQSRAPPPGPTTLPTLSGPAFQQLMNQVVDKLRSLGFMLQSDLDTCVNAGLPADVLDKIFGLSKGVSNIKKDLEDPKGKLARL
jgi:hypothetical protein